MKEIINKLAYNLIMELKKKEFDKTERKNILQSYMDANKLSLREIARNHNIPHTTLFYWLNPERKIAAVERDYKIPKGTLLSQLKILDKTTSDYCEKLKKHSLVLNDESRELIETIKTRWNYIYLNTRRVVLQD